MSDKCGDDGVVVYLKSVIITITVYKVQNSINHIFLLKERIKHGNLVLHYNHPPSSTIQMIERPYN